MTITSRKLPQIFNFPEVTNPLLDEVASYPWKRSDLVVDLSFAEANHEITVADLEQHAPEIQPGDIVLVRTDWTEK
jgi:kynurenine formamidase